MASELRIIRIIRDKDPVTGEDREAYTIDFSVEAEDSSKLALEIAKCPFGDQIAELLKRAEFIPSTEQLEKDYDKELEKHDKDVEEKVKDEVLDKVVEYLRDHNKPNTAEAIEKLFEDKDEEKAEAEQDEEEQDETGSA